MSANKLFLKTKKFKKVHFMLTIKNAKEETFIKIIIAISQDNCHGIIKQRKITED